MFRRRGGERVSAPAQRDDHRPGSDEDDEEGMRVDGKLGKGMMRSSGTLDRDVRKRKAADRRRRNGDNAEYLE